LKGVAEMSEQTRSFGGDKIALLRDLLDLVDDSEISSIKSTVSELIRLINDPKSSAKDLKEVIQLDPPLAGKLLKLANSAYFGFPRTIGDIKEAVVCVGFNELKELALNQKISQLFNQGDAFAGYSRSLLWKHCVAVAICGKLIYTRELNLPGGNAYVVGLLHDIGIIIEDQFLLDTFFQILDEYGSGAEAEDFPAIELNLLGYDHTDIGHALAIDWNFPEESAAAIRYHHSPMSVGDVEAAVLTHVLYISDFICQRDQIGFGDAPDTSFEVFRKSMDKLNSIARVKITDKKLEAIMEEVRENIARMEKTGWF
jgi:HD-like signal output (HDOD) protein